MENRFEPRYADYAARVRESLAAQPLMSALLGAEASRIEPGRVDVVVAVRDEMLQPYGNVHGVIASAVADSAAGYAAQTLLAEGSDVVTVEYKINFLAPGVGTRIRARRLRGAPGTDAVVLRRRRLRRGRCEKHLVRTPGDDDDGRHALSGGRAEVSPPPHSGYGGASRSCARGGGQGRFRACRTRRGGGAVTGAAPEPYARGTAA